MRIRYAILGVLIVSALPAAHAGDIYKWRDANGHVHFGDQPPADANTEKVTVRPNVYTTPSIEGLAKALQTDNKVVLYSASWCVYCKRARRYFQEHNIAYTEYDVEKSEKGREDYKRLGARGVPVILVGDRRMNGFSAAAFEKFYRRATR